MYVEIGFRTKLTLFNAINSIYVVCIQPINNTYQKEMETDYFALVIRLTPISINNTLFIFFMVPIVSHKGKGKDCSHSSQDTLNIIIDNGFL